MKNYKICLLLVLACLVCACAKKVSAPVPEQRATAATLADLRDFPQNLEVFAKEIGPAKILMARSIQEQQNARFDSIYFGPWQMRKTSISRSEAAAAFPVRARGFKNNSQAWTQDEWSAMRANANLGDFPSLKGQPGITLRPTDLRELPTHEPRFAKPTPDPAADPFDYFQYSRLPVGTPLLVCHTTQDGRWHYVECPIAGGWVDAADVALADERFRQMWQTGKYAALIKDNVPLPGIGKNGGDGAGDIGAILPFVGKTGASVSVLVPLKEKNGSLNAAEITLPPGAATVKPMLLTPGNVALVGDALMGQAYGWGGVFGLRDCSSMLRDLFAPFGIWLPRNSRSQARSGSIISLAGQTAKEKEQTILRDGEPFLSLAGMPGHITLYVGRWQNRPALFHNVWGVRVIRDGNDDERFVIGRAVVTSITPGMELENLYRPVTFADRLKTLTTLRKP